MPRRKCNTCKKYKKKRASRRKHNESHKKYLSMMRGGMEGSPPSKRPHSECMEGSPPSKSKRPHPEWWDLAVAGTHPDDRQRINDDAIFFSFTPDEMGLYYVDAIQRFVDAADSSEWLPINSIFITSYSFGCDTLNSVIVATNTSLVGPLTLKSLCKNIISFNMHPFNITAFGHRAPPRINLSIQYHDNPITHEMVPIKEHYNL